MEYVNQTIESLIQTDVDALKYKEIKLFLKYLDRLEIGYKDNYQDILELISMIDIYSELDNRKYNYKEFYLNNG